ncbi:MAG TPA: hypothetical protein VMW42_05160 [Desulfatiglandales bacterium]|nr:hypothetical protein [Desulfatiglandales bacterium]
MKALQKFRLEKKLTIIALHELLIENKLNVAFSTVASWCSGDKSSKSPSIENAKRLSFITGYSFADFYEDLPCEDSVETKAVVAAV